MTIVTSSVRKLKSVKNAANLPHAVFLYPKVVIFEDNQNLKVVDIQTKNQDESGLKNYMLSHKLLDRVLQHHFLWLLIESGEIIVINLHKDLQIRIISDNYAKYRINRFRYHGHDLLLLSESGECLRAPYTTEDLNKYCKDGITDLTVTLEKAHVPHSQFKDTKSEKSMHGVILTVESGNIQLKCPVTGLTGLINSNLHLEELLPWEDVSLLTNKSDMCIVNFENSKVLHYFDKSEGTYFPLAVHNNILYYLSQNESEIQICSAWNAAAIQNEQYYGNNTLNQSIAKLSSQETLKEQLVFLVDGALSEGKPSELLTQMQHYFLKIDDFVFLLSIATKLCYHQTIYKSLLYPLQKKIYASSDNNLIHVICDILNKIELLEYIQFRGINSYQNINLFQQNFKELCAMFISKSDMDLASMCWLKYNEMMSSVSSNEVITILNVVPQNIKMSALIIWLKNFVPSLLNENPYFIDIFVRWTAERVFQLEKSGYWPKIGLKFLQEIINVLETSLRTITVRPISIDDLDVLCDHINYIIELKERYRINILLGELSSQSPTEVALIMLRRCYTEDLEGFIQNYLPSFATRHLFELDDVLRSYTESEAASSGGGIDGLRLQIILSAFRSTNNKLHCLLQILKVLDVPWNPIVQNLAVNAAASAHTDFTVTDADKTLAQEIQKELKYAEVKVILKKYNFPLTCTDYSLVLNKLISAPTIDLDDLKTMTSAMTTYNNYSNVLYIDRCLRDCETRLALDYFNKLLQKQKIITLKTIMNKYEHIINTSSEVLIERNYLDFLKGTQLLNDVQITAVENLYHLKNSYDITLNMNNMYNETHVAIEATNWVNDYNNIASSGCGGNVTHLTRALQTRYSIIIDLLRRTSTSHRVRKFIESLIKSHQHGNYVSENESIATVLSEFKDGNNSQLLIDSYNVLIELTTNCIEEHIHYLIHYLSILNALIKAHIVVKNLSVAWKFHYIFLPMSSVTSVNEMISYYGKMSPENNFDFDFANICNRNDIIPFRLIGTILENSIISETPLNNVDFSEAKAQVSKRLLPKVTTSQDLDEVLLTCLLLILDQIKITQDSFWVLDTLKGQNELLPQPVMQFLSTSSIRRAFKLDEIVSRNANSYSPQHVLKSKFNIHLMDTALPDVSEDTWDVKVVIFYVLRQYPETNFDRLVALCRTLNVTINDGLSLQLISLLASWELNYHISYDDLGRRRLYLENNEKELISKCFALWESIDNKDFLKDVLNDFWKNGEVTLHGRLISINPFYYEVYMCIYYLMFGSCVEMRNIKEYFLLNFLKEYERKSAPKQYEFELFSVKGVFPEIGHYRLPFHLFMREDMWSNLKSEITLETYERWLPAVALLALDADIQTARDMICSNALKQTMTSRKRNDNADVDMKESEPWRLTSKEEPLLRAAHKCVRHIANMEWAGACLFYVLQGCARGADQVAAAQLCYQFTQRWAALQPGNRAVRQMERLHSTLSTRHALHKIEWACEEFVRLTAEPAQLIRALYLHPDFVNKMSRHDVNRAASEIADKNGINISSIRIQILENILEKASQENQTRKFANLDNKDLMIAKYILKATCSKMGAIYLSRIAFDDESDHNRSKKLRALQCLMSVVDTDTSMKVTNQQRDALWMSLLDLLYTVQLEKIDMPWVVATFMQDKGRAIEQMLQTVGGNIEGLKIAAEIAQRYGSMQVIPILLPLLLRSALYEEMIPLLLKISYPPDEVVCKSWRAVILSPFQKADYPITERQRTKCINVINLLPVCPVIRDEDLLEIWKNCMRCKCHGLGCLVLPYMTMETRQSIPELQKIDRRTLIASLKNLHTETYLVSGAMFVIENMASRSYR